MPRPVSISIAPGLIVVEEYSDDEVGEEIQISSLLDAAGDQLRISLVRDRPGHDHRYAIDPSKIERELGRKPKESFESGLEKTIAWYLANKPWWEAILHRGYQARRLG